ncbi:MAG: hypothetical protein ABW110_20170 [Steroidobacteraceae bacterium]
MSCHGDDARGDEDGFVPSLRNQHYTYLLGEIKELGGGHRSNVDPDLIRFLNSLDQEERMACRLSVCERSQATGLDVTCLPSVGADR